MNHESEPGETRRVLGGPAHPRDVTPTAEELGAPAEAWGRRSAMMHVGSLALEISGLDDRLRDLVRAAYGSFVVGGGDEPTFNARHRPAGIEVLRSPRPSWLYLPREEGRCEEARLFARRDGEGFGLWSYFFAGRLDDQGTTGRLLLCDASDLDVGQALENFLRFFIATAAVRIGGFLLHSGGVIHGERAFLFFGPSGAGKSTTVSHAPPDATLLGDDLVLVEPWRGSFRACGVPFRGTFQGPTLSTASAPIALACRLFQAQANRLETAPKAVQVAEVLGEVPFLMEDRELQSRAAALVQSFVEYVPVRRLHLVNDGSYWPLVQEAAAER